MNDYEQLIEMMFADGTLDQSVRQKIEGMNDLQKRLHIVKILDKGLGLFTKIEGIMNLGKMDYIKEIIKLLKDYVLIADVEKKKFGEVMTPLTLIKDMLSILPQDVWSNPNFKWLDSCNGTGPYPIMVIYKLMNGLRDWEPDDEKRYKHIIKNMIYVGEIQPKNMFLYMNAVDPMNEYNLNIYTGSFIEKEFDYHMKNVWSVDKVDIIIGNPPYNTGTEGGNGSRDLWDKFVIKSEKIIKTGGFLLYVHPSKWRRPESELLPIYKRNNLKYLEIHSKQDGKKVFDAVTRYDWYLLQIIKNEGLSTIIDEIGEQHTIDINDWDWIPNYNFEIIKNIISKNNNLEIIYSRSLYGNDKKWMSKNQNDINIYPCVYGMYKDFTCSYYYSSVQKGHFDIPKVILGCGEKLYPKLDFEGNFGIMQNAFGIKIETIEEGINIKNAIESEKFKKIIESTKWLNFQTDYKMFKSFKKDFWIDFI
jgi:hypothetical protein